MHLAPSQGTINDGSSPSLYAGRKFGCVEQALLWTLLHEDPQCPSRMLHLENMQRLGITHILFRPAMREQRHVLQTIRLLGTDVIPHVAPAS